jgi:ABC-type phosphate transport system auxiliary subunit
MKYKLQKTVAIVNDVHNGTVNYLADVELVEVPEEEKRSDGLPALLALMDLASDGLRWSAEELQRRKQTIETLEKQVSELRNAPQVTHHGEQNLRLSLAQAQLTASILTDELAKARTELEQAKSDKAYQTFTRLCMEKRDLQVELDRQRGILADVEENLATALTRIDNKS